ncbi:transporter substrate-binding domain-containing protein [Naumannella halotolerans]|uniref:transporter substrate-binding domain-containing protein n=1 Tax=Naumannella halotolerans TaxID=993414 RepID=UPI00370D7445
MTHRPRAALATCSILAIAAVASACSGSDTAAEPDAPETVVVGMSWPYEPWQVGDGSGTKEGVEPEILAAIGEKQNLEFELQNVDFSGIITGTQSGKYDLAVSALGIYGDRLNALNFVPDARTGYTSLVNAEDEGKYSSLQDLCGVSAAVLNGTRNQSDVEVANGTAEPDSTQQSFAGVCADNPIQAEFYNDQAGQDLAFQTGKAEVEMLTLQVAQQKAADSEGKYAVAEPYAEVLFGMGVAKNNTELSDKLIAGMKEIIADGTYEEILTKYGLDSSSAVTESEVTLVTE